MENKTRVSLRLEDSLVKKIDGLKGKRKTRNQVISELLYKALEKPKEIIPQVSNEKEFDKLANKAHKAAILTSKLAEVLIIQYVKNVETIYTEAKKRYRKEIEDIT
jgi:metal-responsive CopG/Arc/MetJ family transcriptional regulator